MLASTDSKETQLLIDDSTNAVYVDPGYLLYGRSGNLNAWRFDAGKGRLIDRPAPVVKEKLSFWEAKNLVVLSASGSGTHRVPAGGGAADHAAVVRLRRPGARSLGTPGFYTAPRVSPDGKKLAFVLFEAGGTQSDLWVMDLQYERNFRLTQKSGVYLPPVWSRDSERLMFVCQPKGVQDLCVRSLREGGDIERPPASPNWKTSGSWMPDGRSVFFDEQDPETNRDLKMLNLSDKPESRVLLATPFDEQYPEASPDGRWVAYVSNETGRAEVDVRPALRAPSSSGRSRPRRLNSRVGAATGGSSTTYRRTGS